ncbi:MAG TPA: serine/threonine-protein kinase [Blastocatellia bacterium]|nr:serine/threonine-protein kinase [Blastocatellia bacterium]
MSAIDRWQQIEDVFHAALEQPPGERHSFLATACASDPDLRIQVEALLRAHEKGGNPLDSPVSKLAANLPVAESDPVTVGSVIDHYQILAPLGKGGMGAVYLAMHLGTQRYVALKVIAPQLMTQQEFVTRFRREAEAAGRLRHPNVVDVTDFGFARLGTTDIAYLVMEYLDGCTLADVLAEEVRLPLMWVVDILEQTCSAVDEAHQQGTIHRDLKPENIWLEPNRRGGYTVKVLDFGLAKLAPASPCAAESAPAQIGADAPSNVAPPPFGETSTEEVETLLLRPGPGPLSNATADGLTRIGSLMGTPLYMSPEQCRGQRLGPQSDIYSLGVIAYQMLCGRTPFGGEMAAVIAAHLEGVPTPLREVNPKTPKKIDALIMSALAKDPAARPQSATAFASALRAQAEGLGTLLRRTFALYSEHFHTLMQISLISYLPLLALTLLQFGGDLLLHTGVVPRGGARAINVAFLLLSFLVNFICGVIASGAIVPIIIQLIVAPLRPIQPRAAFAVLRRRLRPFITTSLIVLLLFYGGSLFFVVPGFIAIVLYALYVPVVIIEDLQNWAALRRSLALARRAMGTVTLVVILEFVLPVGAGILLEQESSSWIKGEAGFSASLGTGLAAVSTILYMPLIAIVEVLLYLKTRQAGGEMLKEMLAQFEEEESPLRKWQTRKRKRRLRFDRPGSE